MSDKGYKLYRYRWVVLGLFMFINITIQILWISFAPITGPAASYYGVTDLQIGFLSMVFMIAFIPLSIPISWMIDTWGFHRAVGLGAILMGVFGILRGLAGQSYTLVLWSTVGIAISQPFLLNSWTTVPAKWFGLSERATAVGMVTLSSILGTALGMILTPILYESYSIATMQLIYGGAAALSAVLFVVFTREKPPSPPCPEGMEERALMLDGLKHAVKIKPFWFFLAISFIGLGIFNGLTTWVEGIIRPRGFTPADAGTIGALLLVGGLIGAIVIPSLSDKQQKRQRFLYLGFSLAIPGLIGLTYATSSWLLMVSSFWLGFFLVSTFPVGMQYAAEITHPTPEGTSNGLVQLFGQAAVVFVYIMEAMRTSDGSFSPSLLLAAGLLVLSVVLITQMKDPKSIAKQ
ncbi:MFS transporter [Chloroflexota bacterium]